MIVKSITDPYPVWNNVRRFMSDDSNELAKEGDFLGVFDGDFMAGAFLMKPWNTYTYEIHGGVHSKYWGRGPEVCWHLGDALFRYTPCLKIVAIIPEYNRLMRKCVQAIGMKQEGVLKDSWLKWYKLYDLIVYGITKKERGQLCQQYQRLR